MPNESSVSLTVDSGALGLTGDPPRKRREPMLELQGLINGEWRAIEIIDSYWHDGAKKFVVVGLYVNASQVADFIGALRLCLLGRPVTAFPLLEVTRVEPGQPLNMVCPFGV